MTDDLAVRIGSAVVRDAGSLERWWRDFAGSEEFDPELPHVMIGALANAAADHATTNPDDLRVLFKNIEIALKAADGAERYLLVIGLLEGIQNAASHTGTDVDFALTSAGPLTKRFWEALVNVWSGRLPPSKFNEMVADG
jgi:hypothetical protein